MRDFHLRFASRSRFFQNFFTLIRESRTSFPQMRGKRGLGGGVRAKAVFLSFPHRHRCWNSEGETEKVLFGCLVHASPSVYSSSLCYQRCSFLQQGRETTGGIFLDCLAVGQRAIQTSRFLRYTFIRQPIAKRIN